MVCLSSNSVRCVSFKPDNRNVVVSASWDKTIKTFDITSGSCLSTLKVDNMAMSLSYAPSGDILAVGDFGGNIHFFNAKGEKALSPVRGHSDVVASVCFSSDGKKLTSGSADSTARNWNPATRASLS